MDPFSDMDFNPFDGNEDEDLVFVDDATNPFDFDQNVSLESQSTSDIIESESKVLSGGAGNSIFFPTAPAPVLRAFGSGNHNFSTPPISFSPQFQTSHFAKPISLRPVANQLPKELSTGEVFHTRARRKPKEFWNSTTPIAAKSDELFHDFCNNSTATINPSLIGFIPSFYWPNKDIPFGDIVLDYFQRKNNANCRFIHKLYDALMLSSLSEIFQQLTGVRWLTNIILEVNKGQFARLLGIKSIDGSLFHQQGNFSTHGFIEIDSSQAPIYCKDVDISHVDFNEIRLLVHGPGIFIKGVPEISLLSCKWVNEHKKK